VIPIGDVASGQAVLDVVCGKCKFEYRFKSGVLEKRLSRQVTLQRQTTKQDGIYHREYEFRLRTTGGGLDTIVFTVPGRDDWILARSRDEVTFVYTLKGGVPDELVTVLNETTNDVYPIAKPGSKAHGAAVVVGCVVSFGLLVVVWFVAGSFVAAILVAAIGGGTSYALYVKFNTPRQELTGARAEEIEQRQGLLAQKQQLLLAMAPSARDFERHGTLAQALLDLREKMLSVGEEMYRSRIEALEAALTILEEQVGLDRQLMEGYAQAIKIVEIEIESGNAAEALPATVANALAAKAEELDAIRKRNEELETNLLANEEVEQALKGA
jgi:hypothetical protein